MNLTIEQALKQAVSFHAEGKIQDAERLYRAILQTQPTHPDANHNLGVLAVSGNKAGEALSLFKTALKAKWWGDPVSPDYMTDGMNAFGNTSIKRKVGSIFSEDDQFILRTLFYPFSVRFGYVEENLEHFKADLISVRPMLDSMFGFERTIIENTNADAGRFIKSGSYLYLRSGLIERWNTLNKFHTYPEMITPLLLN